MRPGAPATRAASIVRNARPRVNEAAEQSAFIAMLGLVAAAIALAAVLIFAVLAIVWAILQAPVTLWRLLRAAVRRLGQRDGALGLSLPHAPNEGIADAVTDEPTGVRGTLRWLLRAPRGPLVLLSRRRDKRNPQRTLPDDALRVFVSYRTATHAGAAREVSDALIMR